MRHVSQKCHTVLICCTEFNMISFRPSSSWTQNRKFSKNSKERNNDLWTTSPLLCSFSHTTFSTTHPLKVLQPHVYVTDTWGRGADLGGGVPRYEFIKLPKNSMKWRKVWSLNGGGGGPYRHCIIWSNGVYGNKFKFKGLRSRNKTFR